MSRQGRSLTTSAGREPGPNFRAASINLDTEVLTSRPRLRRRQHYAAADDPVDPAGRAAAVRSTACRPPNSSIYVLARARPFRRQRRGRRWQSAANDANVRVKTDPRRYPGRVHRGTDDQIVARTVTLDASGATPDPSPARGRPRSGPARCCDGGQRHRLDTSVQAGQGATAAGDITLRQTARKSPSRISGQGRQHHGDRFAQMTAIDVIAKTSVFADAHRRGHRPGQLPTRPRDQRGPGDPRAAGAIATARQHESQRGGRPSNSGVAGVLSATPGAASSSIPASAFHRAESDEWRRAAAPAVDPRGADAVSLDARRADRRQLGKDHDRGDGRHRAGARTWFSGTVNLTHSLQRDIRPTRSAAGRDDDFRWRGRSPTRTRAWSTSAPTSCDAATADHNIELDTVSHDRRRRGSTATSRFGRAKATCTLEYCWRRHGLVTATDAMDAKKVVADGRVRHAHHHRRQHQHRHGHRRRRPGRAGRAASITDST